MRVLLPLFLFKCFIHSIATIIITVDYYVSKRTQAWLWLLISYSFTHADGDEEDRSIAI